jgi:hypothetical protein
LTANVHPVFASQSDRADALLTAVVVDFDSSVFEVGLQSRPLPKDILARFTQRAFRERC